MFEILVIAALVFLLVCVIAQHRFNGRVVEKHDALVRHITEDHCGAINSLEKQVDTLTREILRREYGG